MGRRGRRSEFKRQQRWLSRYLSTRGYICENRENVNRLTPNEIEDALIDAGFNPYISLYRSVEQGEVMSDGRGEGTLQRMIDDE